MKYKYGYILNFDPKYWEKVVYFFKNKESEIIDNLKKIEQKYNHLTKSFNILHPNIKAFIGGYLFDREKRTLQINEDINININHKIVKINIDNINTIDISDNNVIPIDKRQLAESYLSSKLLSKNSREYLVRWTYQSYLNNIDKESITDDTIISFGLSSEMFFKKNREYFPKIYSKTISLSEQSAFTKAIGESEFNLRANNNIVCNSKETNGDSFSIKKDTLSVNTPIAIYANNVEFPEDYIYTDTSPISIGYANSHFLRKNLSNATSLIVSEKELTNRQETEIVSNDNILEIKNTLLDIDEESVEQDFKVLVSEGDNALNFKTLKALLLNEIDEYYREQISKYISSGKNQDVLEELLTYITDQIEKLKESGVLKSDCKSPLSLEKSPACDITCEDLSDMHPKRFVTKQILKTFLLCSMDCGDVL